MHHGPYPGFLGTRSRSRGRQDGCRRRQPCLPACQLWAPLSPGWVRRAGRRSSGFAGSWLQGQLIQILETLRAAITHKGCAPPATPPSAPHCHGTAGTRSTPQCGHKPELCGTTGLCGCPEGAARTSMARPCLLPEPHREQRGGDLAQHRGYLNGRSHPRCRHRSVCFCFLLRSGLSLVLMVIFPPPSHALAGKLNTDET